MGLSFPVYEVGLAYVSLKLYNSANSVGDQNPI